MERSDLGDLRKIVREAERLGQESWAFSLATYGDEFDEDGYLTVSWFWDGDEASTAVLAVRLEREPEPRVFIRLEKEDKDPWLELPCNPLSIAAAMRLVAG